MPTTTFCNFLRLWSRVSTNDKNGFFPAETVQGAYVALKSLGYDLGNQPSDLQFTDLSVSPISLSDQNFNDITIILWDKFEILFPGPMNSYYEQLIKGLCGIYNILGKPVIPIRIDDTILKTIHSDIYSFYTATVKNCTGTGFGKPVVTERTTQYYFPKCESADTFLNGSCCDDGFRQKVRRCC